MAFWKKEDPWDVDPEKRRRQSEKRLAKEEDVSPAEALKDKLLDAVTGEEGGGESLMDAAARAKEKVLSAVSGKKKEEEPEGPPMLCPWCGKPMQRQYLWGSRGVYLGEKKPGFFSSGLSSEYRNVCDEGNFFLTSYKTMWYCDDCGKIAADLPPLPEHHSIYDQPPAKPEAGTEEKPETEGEAP